MQIRFLATVVLWVSSLIMSSSASAAVFPYYSGSRPDDAIAANPILSATTFAANRELDDLLSAALAGPSRNASIVLLSQIASPVTLQVAEPTLQANILRQQERSVMPAMPAIEEEEEEQEAEAQVVASTGDSVTYSATDASEGTAAIAAGSAVTTALAESELASAVDTAKAQVTVLINNAFVLVCAILVIIMSVPGVALFYGGLVRAKNVLSILQQCLVTFSLCMLLWFIVGYSWAFSGAGTVDSFWDLLLGNSDRVLLAGVSVEALSGNLNELNFVIFQGAFCAISACLIVGAVAERMRFGALMLALALWVLGSYVPLAHMVWGQGLIEHYFAAYDFAGGTVVHINAAMAAIVAAKMLGPRIDLNKVALAPHSLPLTYLGCGLLWMGWFGFNAGSELSPDGVSALAFVNTVLAPAAAALVWALLERVLNGKSSSLGSASGVLAGLVAITPACAFVGPLGAVALGAISGAVCLWGVRGFKRLTKIDDSLDVFGIHGLGAIVGALLTGVFCAPELGGMGYKGFHEGWLSQFAGQLGSVVVAIVWSGVVSYVAFTIAGKLCHSLRVSRDDERAGLDLTFHGERGYS